MITPRLLTYTHELLSGIYKGERKKKDTALKREFEMLLMEECKVRCATAELREKGEKTSEVKLKAGDKYSSRPLRFEMTQKY